MNARPDTGALLDARGEREVPDARGLQRAAEPEAGAGGVARVPRGARVVVGGDLLIADGDGFVTLDKVDGRGAMSRDSYGRPFRDHVRGEILSNRAALEWIAARRTQRAAVAA